MARATPVVADAALSLPPAEAAPLLPARLAILGAGVTAPADSPVAPCTPAKSAAARYDLPPLPAAVADAHRGDLTTA